MKFFVFTVLFVVIMFAKINGQDYHMLDYKNTEDIINDYERDSLNYRSAWKFSFIGEYVSSLKFWDLEEQKTSFATESQIEQFKKYKPVNAANYILDKAEREKVIIINEAHHQPYHRVFTTTLLDGLYKRGYKYIGLEAIWKYDSLFNKRKYPICKTGYYLKDPYFANLMREALRIGFEIFDYETTRDKSDSLGINLREIDQARNIKKILDKDINAKILIHCGFGHLTESPVPGWGKAMAGRLIEYTGINPLTIDQVIFTEHSDTKYENPLFKITNLDYFAVFVDSLNKPFNGLPVHKEYDFRVYHPRTTFLHNRPSWVFSKTRTPFYLKDISTSFPCLVFAYLFEENIDVFDDESLPIPYDVIELKKSISEKALSLKKGKYNVIIQERFGKKIKLVIEQK